MNTLRTNLVNVDNNESPETFKLLYCADQKVKNME